MQHWKLNLIVLWFGQFLVMSGMTMIIPFLPLYIQEFGVTNPDDAAVWAGIIFAANFLTAFLFQPLWGKVADMYGRKLMILRSGFGMAIVMTLMGFSTAPWHLLLLRLLNGMISGFMPAATSLVSANTPKEHMGFAMGLLQSGAIAGTIMGPFIGGLMAEWIGFRAIFYITGTLLFAATLVAWIFLREDFNKKRAMASSSLSIAAGYKQLRRIPQLPALFGVTFMIQFSLLSSMPLLPLFVQELQGDAERIALYAGLVGSVTGLSNMLASPILGRLGDRIGSERILKISLFGAAITYVPQIFVENIWQLLAARFFFGMFVGGLIPSVNSLIRNHTPEGMEGRAFSFNTSFLALGNMVGPTLGGIVAVWLSIRGVFAIGAVMLLLNAWWVHQKLRAHPPHSHNLNETRP
ncbi:MFS transporter [Marinicrinis sediminis]|uniref:MFS transporter n=1 Tax=Marinicrinis sediminis TaxID=1652465 RepID=A0ABW5R8J8_9BACL